VISLHEVFLLALKILTDTILVQGALLKVKELILQHAFWEQIIVKEPIVTF
jgi:hypothetical protein